MFLVNFSVIEPGFGLLFWTTITFLILWGLLGKLAWKPIQQSLKDRTNSIDDALKQAEKARTEMAALNAKNEELLATAREERSRILQEAKVMSDNIIKDAKDKAKSEAELAKAVSAHLVESATLKADATALANEIVFLKRSITTLEANATSERQARVDIAASSAKQQAVQISTGK